LLGWVVLTHVMQGDGAAAVGSVGLILAVFGTVVLHELSHALTARRFGIRTRDITLLPIGGISSLERMPEKPSQELLVALAGPAVNLVIALVLFGIISALGGPLGVKDLQVVGGSFLTKFMWINVSLAVFNLLPAFPMDGGRVLRAALALRTSYARATELAARIGQGMALVFGVLGLLFNPILLVIALFVWMGAHQESSLIQLRALLGGIPIQNAMITDFRALEPREPLSRAVEFILAGFQHDFPVIDGKRAVGVLTRSDVVRGLAEAGKAAPVEDWMHSDFGTAEPTETLERALDRLSAHEAGTIVVAKDAQVLGLVTPENIGELMMFETAIRKGQGRPAGR
jgi:Zn-dependent protease